jgi:hypothetical protein
MMFDLPIQEVFKWSLAWFIGVIYLYCTLRVCTAAICRSWYETKLSIEGEKDGNKKEEKEVK